MSVGKGFLAIPGLNFRFEGAYLELVTGTNGARLKQGCGSVFCPDTFLTRSGSYSTKNRKTKHFIS